MVNVSNYKFLTANQQRFLLFLYDNGEKEFKSQTIFNNQQWFMKEMEKLLKFGVICKDNRINNDMRKRIELYSLTFKGQRLVENYIMDYTKSLLK